MKPLLSRSLMLAYCGLLLTIIAVGCSLKQDPSESLPVCGNHSCGTLQMVTTDTSSDGYHYLETAVSPDGSRICFTCDWAALPWTAHPADPIPIVRQLAILNIPPAGEQAGVRQFLSQEGASLVQFLEPVQVVVRDTTWELAPMTTLQKGKPSWIDNDKLLFWMHTERGDRLFTADLRNSPSIVPQMVYYERDDRRQGGQLWHHHDPALSPDRQWVAFTRFGSSRTRPDSISRYTQASLWVASLTVPQLAFQVTNLTAVIGKPCWSPDGRRIAFHATLDIAGDGSNSFYGTELFSVAFDTTGLAANQSLQLNRNLKRLTFTSMPEGNPLPIYNEGPVYSPDGSTILFVSDRRAPSITLHDRSIWRIPADGSLDPIMTFFTREDDIDPSFFPGDSRRIVLSSSIGFPSEMLDRLEAEAVVRIADADSLHRLSQVQIEQQAAAERRQLEYFRGVMTHLYIYSGW